MTSEPALLLVHGAWHRPWCWEELRPELAAIEVRSEPEFTVESWSAKGDRDQPRIVFEGFRPRVQHTLNAGPRGLWSTAIRWLAGRPAP